MGFQDTAPLVATPVIVSSKGTHTEISTCHVNHHFNLAAIGYQGDPLDFEAVIVADRYGLTYVPVGFLTLQVLLSSFRLRADNSWLIGSIRIVPEHKLAATRTNQRQRNTGERSHCRWCERGPKVTYPTYFCAADQLPTHAAGESRRLHLQS